MVQEKFVNTILEVLSPMPDVTAINDNKFIEVKTELITRLFRPKNKIDQSDLDTWLTKGKTITISNIRIFSTKI